MSNMTEEERDRHRNAADLRELAALVERGDVHCYAFAVYTKHSVRPMPIRRSVVLNGCRRLEADVLATELEAAAESARDGGLYNERLYRDGVKLDYERAKREYESLGPEPEAV